MAIDANVRITVKNFKTPNFALATANSNPHAPATSISLKDVSAAQLSMLCDRFREEIFEKSGQKDPRLED